ncbi:MAG: hypothetical protein ACRCW0_06230 [Clostridium sp.]
MSKKVCSLCTGKKLVKCDCTSDCVKEHCSCCGGSGLHTCPECSGKGYIEN